MSARRVIVGSCLGVAAACASSGARVLPPSGNTAYGVYHFKNVLTSASPAVTLEGDVLLLPDSVAMSLAGSPCTWAQASRTSTQAISYACGEFLFSFSRLNPLRENSYLVPTSKWVDQRVCRQTRQNAQGVEVCVRYGNDRVEQRSQLRGRLQFVM
jgi:hypothetical protein